MTTADYIAKVRRYCQFDLDLTPDVDQGETTDAQIVESLNDAQRRLGSLAPIFDPMVTLTLSSSPNYDLSSSTVCARTVVKCLDVVINGKMLMNRRGSKPGPWSLAELEGDYAQWRSDAAGTPLRWAHLSDNSIVLHPTPDTDAIAATNYISGHVLPADLSVSSPTGTSQLPIELQEHLIKLAAAIEAEPVAKEQSQFAKIQKWQTEALAAADAIGRRNRSAKAPLGSTSGRSKPDYLRV